MHKWINRWMNEYKKDWFFKLICDWSHGLIKVIINEPEQIEDRTNRNILQEKITHIITKLKYNNMNTIINQTVKGRPGGEGHRQG